MRNYCRSYTGKDNVMEPSEWKVVYRYHNGVKSRRFVTGFLPLLNAIRYACSTPCIHIVEVGGKVGPALRVFGIARGEGEE